MSAEEKFAEWLKRYPERSLDRQTRLDELLIYLNLSVARVEDLLSKTVELLKAIPVGQSLPSTILTIPLGLDSINAALQAIGAEGKTDFPSFRLAWSIPAGFTTVMQLSPPANWVCTGREVTLFSDFYDVSIMTRVFVDDRLVTPIRLQITGPCRVDFGLLFIKRRVITIETWNGSGVDAQLSMTAQLPLVEKSFFETFHQPILNYVYTKLNEVTKL